MNIAFKKIATQKGLSNAPKIKQLRIFKNVAISKCKAHSQFNKIKEALLEVELIRVGKIKAKSLDEFLTGP